MFGGKAIRCKLRKQASRPATKSSRCLAALLLLLLLSLVLPVAADAYTLVLRSGRRVEIPAQFIVSSSGVTYEVAPGFSITVQMSSIDIANTESANQQPTGSLIKQTMNTSKQNDVPSATPPPPAPAVKTAPQRVVTNNDLEASRQARLTRDEADERERVKRGLPSKEELQSYIEEQDKRLLELARQLEASQAKARDEALRAEISALNGRLNELSVQQSQPFNAYGNYFPSVGFYPYLNSYPYVYQYPISPFYAAPYLSLRFGRLGAGHRRNYGGVFGARYGSSPYRAWGPRAPGLSPRHRFTPRRAVNAPRALASPRIATPRH